MPSPLRSLVVFMAIAMAPGTARAAVSWVGDFETGDTSQFSNLLNPEVGGSATISVITETVVQGTYAGRIQLVNEAEWANGLKRVEFQHLPAEGLVAEGQTSCFAMSYYLPEVFPRGVEQTIAYWESNDRSRQSMAFRVNREQVYFITQAPEYQQHWRGNGMATAGRWHRLAMCVEWSLSEGRVDVWYDGEQVVTAGVAQTLMEDANHFVQFGLLRDAVEFEDSPIIFIDDVVVGESVEDVRPSDFPAPPETGSTGSQDEGSSSGVMGATTSPEESETQPSAPVAPPQSGCSCSSASSDASLWVWLMSILAVRRRRYFPTPA